MTLRVRLMRLPRRRHHPLQALIPPTMGPHLIRVPQMDRTNQKGVVVEAKDAEITDMAEISAVDDFLRPQEE